MPERWDSIRVDGTSLDVHRHPTEVLVVGGGLAGCWAAHRASERGRHVTVVDKSRVGAGGASPFAGAVVLCMGPEDDFEAFLEEQIRDGAGINDPDWIEALYHENYERVRQLHRWGAPVERDEQGELLRRKVDIGSRKTIHRLKYDSVRLMKFFYKRLKRRGHETRLDLVSQTPIVRLIERSGRVVGAVGVNRQENHLTVFPAEAVVLASGGCGFKGNHFAIDSVCGEALDMVLDVGGTLSSMEFSNGYIATCRHINTHGQSVLAATGGEYINAKGEAFLHRYAEEVPAPVPVVCRAMAQEVEAGRGPIYFDLRDVDEEDVRDWKDTFYLIQRLADRKGIDLFDEPLEWVPGMTGTIGGSGGVRVEDRSMSTGVPGLYVAGDAACKTPVVGAGSGITFMNLAWANATGYWAGEAAASDRGSPGTPEGNGPVPEGRLREEVRTVLEPLRRDGDRPLEDLYRRLQEQVMPADVSLLRDRETLERARRDTAALLAEELPRVAVGNTRELSRYGELRASLRTALTMFESALVREESRGWHYRCDFPERDDEEWMRWTLLRGTDDPGAFELSSTPAPLRDRDSRLPGGVG